MYSQKFERAACDYERETGRELVAHFQYLAYASPIVLQPNGDFPGYELIGYVTYITNEGNFVTFVESRCGEVMLGAD